MIDRISLEMLNVNEVVKLVPVMDAVTSAVPENVGLTMFPLISKIFVFSVNWMFSWLVKSTSLPLLSVAVTIIIAR